MSRRQRQPPNKAIPTADVSAYAQQGIHWLQSYGDALTTLRQLTANPGAPPWAEAVVAQLDRIKGINSELADYSPIPSQLQLAHTKLRVAAAQMQRMVDEYLAALATPPPMSLQGATEALNAAERAFAAANRELTATLENRSLVPTEEDLVDQRAATAYLHAALARAEYKLLEDGTVFGSIPGFQGVWADEPTFAACHTELASVLQDWVNYRLAHGLDLPEIAADIPPPITLVAA